MMKINDYDVVKLTDNLWEIPKQKEMLVPGRFYMSESMIKENPANIEAIKQVINVAHLPGIEKYSLAMPDIHWGYGFPIGGVAAMNMDGVVSPGGVGYDINCGVRLATTNLTQSEIATKLEKLVNNLYNNIPTGVGSKGAIPKLGSKELKRLLNEGLKWALNNGYAVDEDLRNCEENGTFKDADASLLSDTVLERGIDQVGTLGSGNHFMEIDVVDEIYDENTSRQFNLRKGQIVLLIHSGSRGLGNQVCQEYINMLVNDTKKYNLPDRQLACTPIKSTHGENYLASMQAAANFAFNNRQVMMHLAKKVFIDSLNISDSELGFSLLYDVCHNIAKIEEHEINGKKKKVCVHRKGATRAFAPQNKYIPERYRQTGQPVLIPGDMGRYSFIAVGTEKAMHDTFGSSCHGAGRNLSRSSAIKIAGKRNITKELREKGIILRSKGHKTIAEEMSEAYKDVSNVIDIMHNEGITTKVAKLKPIGVIKG